MRCEERFSEIYGKEPDNRVFCPYRICTLASHVNRDRKLVEAARPALLRVAEIFRESVSSPLQGVDKLPALELGGNLLKNFAHPRQLIRRAIVVEECDSFLKISREQRDFSLYCR